MPVLYPQSLVTYHGSVFEARDCRWNPTALCLIAYDEAVAQEFGFEVANLPPHPSLDWRFEKWVPALELERWIERTASGIYYGIRVTIDEDLGDGYMVAASAPLPGLQHGDRNVWQGKISRAALTDIVIKEMEIDLEPYRKQ